MSNKWILKHSSPPESKIRLLCFPFGGGGSSFYLSWAKVLEPDIEVVPIQLPGRENRINEPTITEMNRLISEIIQAIQSLLDKPYAFFGHSMGAYISFELAREIRRLQLSPPLKLLLSGMRAAHLKDTRTSIANLPDKDLIIALKERYGLQTKEIAMELIQLMLPTIRSDINCIENYRYLIEPPLDCPLVTFAGTSDNAVQPSEVEAWRLHTTSSFNLYQISGDHFFIISSRDQVLKYVHKELSKIF